MQFEIEYMVNIKSNSSKKTIDYFRTLYAMKWFIVLFRAIYPVLLYVVLEICTLLK